MSEIEKLCSLLGPSRDIVNKYCHLSSLPCLKQRVQFSYLSCPASRVQPSIRPDNIVVVIVIVIARDSSITYFLTTITSLAPLARASVVLSSQLPSYSARIRRGYYFRLLSSKHQDVASLPKLL